MDATRGPYVELKKLDTERQIAHVLLYVGAKI